MDTELLCLGIIIEIIYSQDSALLGLDVAEVATSVGALAAASEAEGPVCGQPRCLHRAICN